MLSAHIHTWRQINRGPNTQSVSSHTHMHTRNTHTHPHTDAVTLPPAQPVYIISSVWFCSLLNSMGIWDIFFSLPPSHSLTLCFSLTLSFLLPLFPLHPPPPYPLSHPAFPHHPSFVSQYSLRHKPFHLLLIFSLVSLPAFTSPAICFLSARLSHSLHF